MKYGVGEEIRCCIGSPALTQHQIKNARVRELWYSLKHIRGPMQGEGRYRVQSPNLQLALQLGAVLCKEP